MKKLESDNTEYKQSWHDDHLKTVCAFASSDGGTMFIGKDDNGKTKGISDTKKLLEDIPNKIINAFGFVPDVKLKKENSKEILAIKIKPYKPPVSFRGKFYVRSGSTTQELKGTQLQRFLLEKSGQSWESVIEERAILKDIDGKTITHFKELAEKRFPAASKEKSSLNLLEKLGLLNKRKLTRAAILLFGKEPQKFYISSRIRIGRFKDDATLLGEDEITGNLFQQVEGVMEILKKKYLHSEVVIEGLNRKEELEYPEEALREAIVNAVVHRDYFFADTQFKVYSDQISLWNNGGLVGLTIDELKKKHKSHPRNDLIADVFHKAGFIERWGTGTVKMVAECKSAGLPEPIYEESQGGMQVTFLKDIYTEEYLRRKELNERQIKSILYVKEKGKITNNEFQKICETSQRTATRDLTDLVSKRMLIQVGKTGKGTEYVLMRHKDAKDATKTPQTRQDALDKKLSLLEKELNVRDPDETIQDEFKEETFFKIFDTWLADLMRALIPVAQKFNRFFREIRHHIFVINGIGQVKFTNENVEEIIRKLRADCKKNKERIVGKADFEISFRYNKLKKGGLKAFAFNHNVKIEFQDIKYKVFMDEFSDNIVRNYVQQFDERLLHKPMTKKEIDALAKKTGEMLFLEIDYYTKQQGIR